MVDPGAVPDVDAQRRVRHRSPARRRGDDDARALPLGDPTARVTLYVAEGCGLCAAAHDAVEAVCAELGVEHELVSIDGDDELERRYRVSLPVVEIDGARRFEFFVEPYDLRAALIGA